MSLNTTHVASSAGNGYYFFPLGPLENPNPSTPTPLPKPPKVGKIMAPYPEKAIILHTLGVQVKPKPLNPAPGPQGFGFGALLYAFHPKFTSQGAGKHCHSVGRGAGECLCGFAV